jgi:hypothetical protein
MLRFSNVFLCTLLYGTVRTALYRVELQNECGRMRLWPNRITIPAYLGVLTKARQNSVMTASVPVQTTEATSTKLMQFNKRWRYQLRLYSSELSGVSLLWGCPQHARCPQAPIRECSSPTPHAFSQPPLRGTPNPM